MHLDTLSETNTMTDSRRWLAKTAIILVISLGLFVFAEEFSAVRIFEPESTGWKLWWSYAKDLILPFGFYFFLCLTEKWLGTWRARAMIAFSIFTLWEFGQALYYQVSSSHYVGSFDPLDILMYGLSIGLAVIIERKVFLKLLKFW